MNELFRKVVTGPPLQDLANEQVGVAQYIILCAQAPDPQGRLKLLQSRLRTSTETSSAQNVMHLLSTCLSTTISPDDVEEMVEMVTELALQHPNWPEFIKWVCALVHYYCTDDFTLSLFSEYQVPEVAVRALKDFPQNQQLVLAATALLAHFNMYDIGDGITQLTNALLLHFTDYPTCRISTNALAEFTSYCREIPDRYTQACWEFVAASGVSAIGGILREYTSNEEITTHAARIAANVSSSVTNAISPDSDVMMHFAESLETFPESTELCSYVMRVFSNVPQSPHINWNCIAALFKNTKSESVALECIHFLSSVAINLKELKPQIHATGCVPRVLETMREYPQNAAIQEQACSLLSYLSFDSEAITASITEFGGLELVLKAMKHFPDNEDLLMSSCAALSGLTFNNIRGQQVIVDHEGVALIIDAMRKGRKARLQENGCLVMGTMCWNADLKADVVRLGGVKVIMKALEEHYTCSGLVKNACRALAQVAFNCDRYRDEMSADGVIPLIIRGMEQHPNYDRAQMHGCVALSYLSWTNEGNAAQITAHRGYKVVVDAMRNHPINHEVQEHACRALANISNVSLEDSAAALEQMVAAMRRHERVSEVQEEACRAIVTLSLVSPINKNRLFELNGAAAVIMAMQNFPDTQLVQQEACNALAHLAYEHAQLNRAVTDLNGVELLLTAMKTHRSSPKVQLNACGGLSALAFDNTIAQQQIFELGGVQCVIYAMDHFERLRMLELGCSVLGTLAWNTEIKERVAIDAIPEILKAMRIHENSPLLQKSTCRAISQFAFNSENNRHLLAEAGAIPLIVNAMRMHLGTEKLVVHALKALTYLCWENTEVAETIIAERVEEVLQHIVEHYALTQRVFNEAIHLSKILFRKTNGSPSPNLRIMSPPNVSPMSMNYMYTPAPRRDREESNPPPTPHPRDDYLSLRGTPSVDGDLFMDEPWQTSCTRGRGRGRGRGNGQGRGGPHRGRGGTGPHHSRDGPSHHDPSAGEERFGPPPPTRSRGGRGRGRAGAGGQDSATPWDDPNPENFHGRRNNRGMNWQQAEMVSRDAVDEGAGGRWRVGSRGNRDGGGGRPSGGAGGDDSRE